MVFEDGWGLSTQRPASDGKSNVLKFTILKTKYKKEEVIQIEENKQNDKKIHDIIIKTLEWVLKDGDKDDKRRMA